MRKIFEIFKGILRGLVKNPFWQSGQVWLSFGLSLVINGLLWYIYVVKIRQNPLPFIFSSGLIFLNLILANFIWNREKIASLFLIHTGLLAQILMLIFIRYLLTMVF